MPFEVGILLIAGAVGAVFLILKMVKSAEAGKNSEIEIKDDHIRGKGCVGAIGQDALDLNAHTSIGSFHFTYEQITSVGVDSGWLIIVAAGAQYSLKLPNAEDIKVKIQRNIRKVNST